MIELSPVSSPVNPRFHGIEQRAHTKGYVDDHPIHKEARCRSHVAGTAALQVLADALPVDAIVHLGREAGDIERELLRIGV